MMMTMTIIYKIDKNPKANEDNFKAIEGWVNFFNVVWMKKKLKVMIGD